MSVVHGNDCVLEMLVSGAWYPLLCATDMSFRAEQKEIPSTTIDSGLYTESNLGLISWSMSVSGLTPIDNGSVLSFFYLLQESVRRSPQSIRATYVDDAGGNKQIAGSAYILSEQIDASVNDFANAQIEFKGTGSFTVTAVSDPPPGSVLVYADWWPVVAGGNTVDVSVASPTKGYTIDGTKKILEVDREGTQIDFIGTGGTPGNRQCKYATPNLVFDSLVPFVSGETIWVLFTA